jgi:hypothetical protein
VDDDWADEPDERRRNPWAAALTVSVVLHIGVLAGLWVAVLPALNQDETVPVAFQPKPQPGETQLAAAQEAQEPQEASPASPGSPAPKAWPDALPSGPQASTTMQALPPEWHAAPAPSPLVDRPVALRPSDDKPSWPAAFAPVDNLHGVATLQPDPAPVPAAVTATLIDLPSNVAREEPAAQSRDGVATLALPPVPAAKPRPPRGDARRQPEPVASKPVAAPKRATAAGESAAVAAAERALRVSPSVVEQPSAPMPAAVPPAEQAERVEHVALEPARRADTASMDAVRAPEPIAIPNVEPSVALAPVPIPVMKPVPAAPPRPAVAAVPPRPVPSPPAVAVAPPTPTTAFPDTTPSFQSAAEWLRALRRIPQGDFAGGSPGSGGVSRR